MKKSFSLVLAMLMLLSLVTVFASCEGRGDPTVKGEGVMNYADYIAADLDADVVIEGYVQAKQSWWDNKASLYLMDKDGAYFVYNAKCSEEDFAKLTKGTKVKVTGKKAEWAGEVEIGEGAEIEIESGKYFAKILDVTSMLAKEDELIKHQNEYVAIKGVTIVGKTDKNGKECAYFYKYDNSGEEGDDVYFDFELNGKVYTVNIESYLCDKTTDVYKTVQSLKIGDKIDIEGFLYWYNGQSTQVTDVKIVK